MRPVADIVDELRTYANLTETDVECLNGARMREAAEALEYVWADRNNWKTGAAGLMYQKFVAWEVMVDAPHAPDCADWSGTSLYETCNCWKAEMREALKAEAHE